jgi:undecaprenyl diphosphate synthase
MVKSKNLHVGIIPDGNRRWADKHSLTYSKSYNISMKHLGKVIRKLLDLGVKNITVYLLSKDNLQRKRYDLDSVIQAEALFIQNELTIICKDYACRVIHAGKLEVI